MQTNQTEIIVRKLLEGMASRNLTELLKLFADTVDWHIPGDTEAAPWLGRRTTKNEIRQFYELLWKQTDPLSATVDHIFIDGDHAAITGEFSTRVFPSNKIVDSIFSIYITVDNNQIVKYRLLEDAYAVHLALRGTP